MTDINRAMAEFVKWALEEGAWNCLVHDSAEIQDKAEELGLIVRSPQRKDWFILAPEVSALVSSEDRGTA